MQNSLNKQKKIQAYAQVLLETSRAQGRQAEDLEILKRLFAHFQKSSLLFLR